MTDPGADLPMSGHERRGHFGALGVALAVLVCCALPALIAGGFFAAAGGLLDEPLITLAGVATVAGAVVWAISRRSATTRTAEPSDTPDR